jgi:hypothetical protein
MKLRNKTREDMERTAMTFEEILAQARELLQRKGRVSYRALKLQWPVQNELEQTGFLPATTVCSAEHDVGN